jgi:hypothetical protein
MYWCAPQLQAQREDLALKFLALNGYATYFPKLREHRVRRGRKVEVHLPFFRSPLESLEQATFRGPPMKPWHA